MKEKTDTRRRWEDGKCPCCGSNYDDYGESHGPSKTVAEGVILCGWCIERGHDEEDVLPFLLRELVEHVHDMS